MYVARDKTTMFVSVLEPKFPDRCTTDSFREVQVARNCSIICCYRLLTMLTACFSAIMLAAEISVDGFKVIAMKRRK